jgi:hypothetical protein
MYRNRFPFIALTLTFLLSSWLLAGDSLRSLLFKKRSWENVLVLGNTTLSIGASQWIKLEDGPGRYIRDIKINFPLRSVKRGCESVYGAVLARESDSGSGSKRRVTGRYLIRFKYDLRKTACVSNDLSFVSALFPSRLEVQLIDTSAVGEILEEQPRPELLVVSNEGTREIPRFVLSSEPFVGGREYVSPHRAYKHEKFSWTPKKSDDLTLLSLPQDNLKGWILGEINKRITQCEEQKKCDPIFGAIARITDPQIIAAFGRAEKAGIPLSIITNPESRFFPEEALWPTTDLPPWYWLRGNLLRANKTDYLPMHTRFLILGDDTVLSTNSNFSFAQFYTSREFATIYKGGEATAIFKEIFSVIRSGLFYPVHVDLRDKVTILLNADRRRGYAASRMKPHLQITTNEGVRSSAYGIAYEIMSREPKSLTMAMSPLTNSCATYRSKRCFKEILQEYQRNNSLSLLLNGFFYLANGEVIAANENPEDVYWEEEHWRDLLVEMPSFFTRFGLDERGVSVALLLDQAWSSHHERVAVLNSETLISGSANFARPTTLNTIEVIQDKNFACRVESELATATEPYFVVRRSPRSKTYRTYGGCEFIFERINQTRRSPQFIERAQIETAYRKQYGVDDTLEFVVQPEDPNRVFQSTDELLQGTFKRSKIGDGVVSPSSSLCIITGDGRFKPVNVSPHKCW